MIYWISGNTGAGKTTLARALSASIPESIVLDGDTLRYVWPGLGYDRDSRAEQALRVARLAHELEGQGFTPIVAVIAPYQADRDEIDVLCSPQWIFLRGGEPPSERYPYEEPPRWENGGGI